MPRFFDLRDCQRGDRFVVAVRAFDAPPTEADPEGTPLDVTGWRFELALYRPGRSGHGLDRAAVVRTWTAPATPDLAADAEAGLTWADVAAAETAGLAGTYEYEVRAATPDTELGLVLSGAVRFL